MGDRTTAAGEDRAVKTLGGHSLVYAASSFLGQLGSILTFPLYTRALGVEAYGVLALALSASGVLRTLVIAGTNTALMHERISAEKENVARVTGAAVGYVGAATVAVAALGALLFPRLDEWFGLGSDRMLLVALVAFVGVDSLYELVLASARADARPVDYAYSNALRVLTTLLSAGLLLLCARLGPVGAVLGMLAGSGVAGLWLAARLGLRIEVRGAAGWVPRLLREGGPLVPANLASWVANLSDRYLLLLLLGSTTTVGLYSAGYRVGSLITILFAGPFHTAFLPLMLRQMEDGEDSAAYGESSRLFLGFGSLIVIALQAVSVPAVRVLAGAEYAGADRVVGVVAFGCLLSGAAMLMTPAALRAGRAVYLAIAFGVGATLNVLLNFVLIPRIGMYGAAAATLAGYAAVLLTMLRLMPSAQRPPGMVRTLTRLVPVMALTTVPSMLDWGGPLRQAIASIGFAAAGAVAVVIVGVVTRADLALAWRSLARLARGAVSHVVPDTGVIGPMVRHGLRVTLRTPRAVRALLGVQARRLRSDRGCSAGAQGTSVYERFLQLHPDAQQRAISGAEAIAAGQMCTFGHRWTWRSPRDWHLDPMSGRRWRRLPAGMIDVNRVVRDSDVQCPWETSRLEHVWRVALAYRSTAEERLAAWVVETLRSWRKANLVGIGVNWTVAMEVSMRGIAIAEARAALRGSQSWGEGVEREVCTMLEDHLDWVVSHIEWRGRHTQNHYLAALVGVLHMTSQLPGWTEMQARADSVAQALFDSIRDQVNDDGMDFENSLGYHLLVCELAAVGLAACKELRIEIPSDVVERLAGMVSFARALRFADGTEVAFGDDDDDFLFPGVAGYFDEDPIQAANRYEYAAWTCEELGAPVAGAESSSPAVFEQSGVAVLGGPTMRVFVNAMPTGVRGTGPHRHNDALSFCLECGGKRVLVDPGTFRYQSSAQERSRYRSVAAHNTIQVDGTEQNDIGGLFALPQDRIAMSDLCVISDDARQTASARHHGFEAVSGIVHTRAWDYDVRSRVLNVEDSFSATDEDDSVHEFVSRYHFAPEVAGISVEEAGTGRFVVECPACRFEIAVHGVVSAHARLAASTHSPRYRVEVPSSVVEVSWTGTSASRLEMSVWSAEDLDS